MWVLAYNLTKKLILMIDGNRCVVRLVFVKVVSGSYKTPIYSSKFRPSQSVVDVGK